MTVDSKAAIAIYSKAATKLEHIHKLFTKDIPTVRLRLPVLHVKVYIFILISLKESPLNTLH